MQRNENFFFCVSIDSGTIIPNTEAEPHSLRFISENVCHQCSNLCKGSYLFEIKHILKLLCYCDIECCSNSFLIQGIVSWIGTMMKKMKMSNTNKEMLLKNLASTLILLIFCIYF